jgi:ribosomal protein S18 acetylase RimI-like enzyme
MKLERLEWDSTFFGFPIARLSADADLRSGRSEFLRAVSAEGFRCVYLLVDATRAESIAAAESLGFRVRDERVTLARDAPHGTDAQLRPCRPATLDDHPALIELAGELHRGTRFFNDPNFDPERCRELYRTWMRRSCTGWANAVFVSEDERGITGYLTCHRRDPGLGEIGLVGVAERARGRGHARQLIQTGLSWFGSTGTATISVVTQGDNVPALRLYEQAGFRTRSVELWLHFWPSTSGA